MNKKQIKEFKELLSEQEFLSNTLAYSLILEENEEESFNKAKEHRIFFLKWFKNIK